MDKLGMFLKGKVDSTFLVNGYRILWERIGLEI